MSDDLSSIAMLAEPTAVEGLAIKIPHDLTPSEADLYRLLAGNGYKVLRHGWPDFFVVPADGSPGFAVEMKSGSDPVRPGQEEMHTALETAGVRVLVVKSKDMTGAARIARWRSKQDPEIRKQQNREAVQRSRAKKKAERV